MNPGSASKWRETQNFLVEVTEFDDSNIHNIHPESGLSSALRRIDGFDPLEMFSNSGFLILDVDLRIIDPLSVERLLPCLDSRIISSGDEQIT